MKAINPQTSNDICAMKASTKGDSLTAREDYNVGANVNYQL